MEVTSLHISIFLIGVLSLLSIILAVTALRSDDEESVKKSIQLTRDDFSRRSKEGLVRERYDIIICGAGTAGSLLTHRLATRYPKAKILLLESGQDDVRETSSSPNGNAPNNDWAQLIRSDLSAFGEGGHLWHTELETNSDNPAFRTPIHDITGGTFGGTSAANLMVWNRGTKEGTYDRWEQRVGSEFGFTAMNESYKKLENRGQNSSVYSQTVDYWAKDPFVPGAVPFLQDTPGQKFDAKYHGDKGELQLTQDFIPSVISVALQNVLTSEVLGPHRTDVFGQNQMYLDAENPNNPTEYTHYTSTTKYDQSSTTFAETTPYSSGYGYGYTFDNSIVGRKATIRGPEYAGIPQVLNNAVFGPGSSPIIPKSLTARSFAAPSYLYPIMDKTITSNVTILPRSFVTKLLFTNPKDPTECTGVEWVKDGWHVLNRERAVSRGKPWMTDETKAFDTSELSLLQASKNQASAITYRAFASSDVWLCLGAKNSAKQLQLAGIGDSKFLGNLRNGDAIETRVDLQGVGNGVQDTLDMAIAWKHETDVSTGLAAPFPASASVRTWGDIFGLADPTDPRHPVTSTSLQGAPYNADPSIRIKTQPHKGYSDMTLYCQAGDAVGSLGSALWGDIIKTFKGETIPFDVNISHPNWDNYNSGFQDPLSNFNLAHTHGLLCEYFDMNGTGEVQINSSNPFEDALYAPGMGNSESDVDAMVFAFRDTVLPLLQGLSKQRYGPRGGATYAGGSTGATITNSTSITLATPWFPPRQIDASLDPYQNPIPDYNTADSIVGWSITALSALADGAGSGWTETLTVVDYDEGTKVVTIGNGSVVTLDNSVLFGGTGYETSSNVATTGGTGSGLTVDITTSEGVVTDVVVNNVGSGYAHEDIITISTGGGDATIKTLSVAAWSIPGAVVAYALQPPFATPLDTLVYSGPNNRTFARMVRPAGDSFLSAYAVTTLDGVSLTTSTGSNVISVAEVSHGLSVGDFVKISGITVNVNGIDKSHFNDYHIVTSVVDDSFEFVLFWNKSPLGGPGSLAIDSPGLSATAGSYSGPSLTVEKMTFDESKFRRWLQLTYFSGWHKCCSTKMGLADDVTSVVDTRARVYNTKGLRVCDAGIFPVKPNANTMAPVYGITQRLFELISVEEYDSLLKHT
jgi:choline dehydrogenase-like flavoprotein